MKFEEMDYTIGAHFVTALMYDDYTGLDDHEVDALNAWLEQHEMRGGHWDMIGDGLDFTQCEVTNLMSDCITARQYYPSR